MTRFDRDLEEWMADPDFRTAYQRERRLIAAHNQAATSGDETRIRLIARIEQLVEVLRAEGREQEEDDLLDIADFVNYFCAPHMRFDEDGMACVMSWPG